MTTIAVRIGERRGEIAADRRLNEGGSHTPVRKIVQHADTELGPLVFAGTGHWGGIQRLTRWVLTGRRGHMPPCNKASLLVVLKRNRQVEEWERIGGLLVRTVIERSYHAIGSGAAEARGAMYVGASARRAILAAASNDKMTGDGVDVVRF